VTVRQRPASSVGKLQAPGAKPNKEGIMYIGGGLLAVILIIVLLAILL